MPVDSPLQRHGSLTGQRRPCPGRAAGCGPVFPDPIFTVLDKIGASHATHPLAATGHEHNFHVGIQDQEVLPLALARAAVADPAALCQLCEYTAALASRHCTRTAHSSSHHAARSSVHRRLQYCSSRSRSNHSFFLHVLVLWLKWPPNSLAGL